jgi:hypothetical protein
MNYRIVIFKDILLIARDPHTYKNEPTGLTELQFELIKDFVKQISKNNSKKIKVEL